MRNVHGVAGAVTALTILVGCSAPPPSTPMAAAPAPMAATPASTGGGIDGLYRGPSGGTSGNARCGTTKFGYPIRVSGGVVTMASAINGTLEGPVGPDNSLAIEKGRAGLRGQFADGQFTGTYSTGNCSYALTYSKR